MSPVFRLSFASAFKHNVSLSVSVRRKSALRRFLNQKCWHVTAFLGAKKKRGGVGGGYECGTLRGEDASGLGEPPGAPSAQQWDQWKSLPLNRGRNTGRGEEKKKKSETKCVAARGWH